jgi:hypothetical protein
MEGSTLLDRRLAELHERTAPLLDRAVARWVAHAARSLGVDLALEERWDIVLDAMEAAACVISDRLGSIRTREETELRLQSILAGKGPDWPQSRWEAVGRRRLREAVELAAVMRRTWGSRFTGSTSSSGGPVDF